MQNPPSTSTTAGYVLACQRDVPAVRCGHRTPIHCTIQLRQKVEIWSGGLHVDFWIVGVVHAVAQIAIEKVLIRMWKAKPVANLVAHGVLSLSRISCGEVVFVHLGRRSNDPAIAQDDLVDSTPLGVSVVAIADLQLTVDS